MSARSFRSVFMVASCAGAALGCYLVSLRVASERAALEQVETRIVLAQRDIRLIQTEIGTRGRLAQLERWNVKVLALSAPSADQFLEGSFALARLARPQRQPELEAPVVLASAPAPEQRPAPLEQESAPPALVHQASLRLPDRSSTPAMPAARPEPTAAASTPPKTAKESAAPATAPVQPGEAKQKQKTGDNKVAAGSAPVTKKLATAKVDPLAPLPESGESSRPAKESGPTR